MSKSAEKEKSFNMLEKEVNVISTINNPKLGPYLDIFRHYPENVLLQPLGILVGFFRINDFSEESAYIVNFLSSLLRKEYFANPKRSIENSFDGALRKVNLALSEIAKEGNINWLGRIDGVVCVLEKNNLHFGVCGNAKVILLRNQLATEISKDLSSEDLEPNPLKTFVNVSSGRLEKGDKILICGEDVFEIFTLNEIKKGAQRFDSEKFVQFLKTALVNKLDMVGTIVIDVFEKEIKKKELIKETESENINAFSRKTFEKKPQKIENLKEILKKEDESEYTDGKTGHIYIHEEKNEIKKESNFGIFLLLFKEKYSDFYFWLKNKTKRGVFQTGKSLSKMSKSLSQKIKEKMEERKRIGLEKKEELERKKAEIALERAKEESKKPKDLFLTDEEPLIDNQKEIQEVTKEQKESAYVSSFEIEKESYDSPFLARLARRKAELEKEMGEEKKEFSKEKKYLSSFGKFIPDFGKIKNIFTSLEKKQKISILGIILAIIIVPFAFLKIQGVMKAKQAPKQTEQKAPTEREILSGEKNISFLGETENFSQFQGEKKIILVKEKIVAVGDGKITVKEDGSETKEVSWPESLGNIIQAAPMDDLNLALFYTDQGKLISFFLATSQIKENNISIPTNAKITGLGAYLTYAYLVDSENNQIYRYPRAEGGFGEKINWLKDSINLKDACCLAIDENIYLANGNEIMKIFKGNKQDLTLEPTKNFFTLNEIFTNNNTANLYVLDKEWGRIIKYSKDGNLIAQYSHESIKNSTDFVVDEKNNKAYVANNQGLFSVSIK